MTAAIASGARQAATKASMAFIESSARSKREIAGDLRRM
jgi:hypothetical protein